MILTDYRILSIFSFYNHRFRMLARERKRTG